MRIDSFSMPPRGFTLVEILVASSILVVMAALVLSIAANVMQVWNNTSGRLSASNQSRLVLDLMTTDLESLVVQNDPDPWFQLEWESSVHSEDFSMPGSAHLMFFSRVSQESGNQPGAALSAVSYRIGYRDPFLNTENGAFARFALYRAILDPANTFRHALESRDSLKTTLWDRTETSPWEDLGGEGRSLSPRNWSLDVANLLASHVVSMRCRFRYRDTTGQEQTIRLEEGGAQSLVFGGALRVDDQELDFSQIQSLEIQLLVLSQEGARILAAEMDSNPANDRGWTFEEIFTRHGEIFSQRVAFYGDSY